jgi:hypothetical protein
MDCANGKEGSHDLERTARMEKKVRMALNRLREWKRRLVLPWMDSANGREGLHDLEQTVRMEKKACATLDGLHDWEGEVSSLKENQLVRSRILLRVIRESERRLCNQPSMRDSPLI